MAPEIQTGPKQKTPLLAPGFGTADARVEPRLEKLGPDRAFLLLAASVRLRRFGRRERKSVAAFLEKMVFEIDALAAQSHRKKKRIFGRNSLVLQRMPHESRRERRLDMVLYADEIAHIEVVLSESVSD